MRSKRPIGLLYCLKVMLKINNYLRRLPPKKRKVAIGLFEFLKLQLAGNIPFWGTYGINFVLDKGLSVAPFQSLLVATVLSYAAFFFVSDRWVFNHSRGSRHTATNAWRFVIFMSITALVTFNITWHLHELFGISIYIGQFISAGLSITWTFIGMKFWVFAPISNKKTRRPKATRRLKKPA